MLRNKSRRDGSARESGVATPPPAPDCPPGWQTGPPDFVGVGEQRCGTSRWYELIASHPEVQERPSRKELHYFDRFYAGGFTPQDVAGYHAHFPREAPRKVGEWTPLYISSPWALPLLAAAAPDARLLVLLRDPVERYRSALEWDLHDARVRETALSKHAPLSALVRGYYHAHLAGLLRHFDREQVLVLQYERCTQDPQGELRRTFEFLGLDDRAFVPSAQALEAHPRRQSEKPELDDAAREALVEAYSEDVTRLIASFPELDVGLWPNFAGLASSGR